MQCVTKQFREAEGRDDIWIVTGASGGQVDWDDLGRPWNVESITMAVLNFAVGNSDRDNDVVSEDADDAIANGWGDEHLPGSADRVVTRWQSGTSKPLTSRPTACAARGTPPTSPCQKHSETGTSAGEGASVLCRLSVRWRFSLCNISHQRDVDNAASFWECGACSSNRYSRWEKISDAFAQGTLSPSSHLGWALFRSTKGRVWTVHGSGEWRAPEADR